MAALPFLRQTTQHLRNAAPLQFDEFRTAFAIFEAEYMAVLVDATVNIERAQGHAQMCRKLNEMFREIK